MDLHYEVCIRARRLANEISDCEYVKSLVSKYISIHAFFEMAKDNAKRDTAVISQ